MKEIPDYQALYVQGYDKHNVDKTLAGRMLQRSHRLLEDTLPRNFRCETVIEVGAGTGHHYAFVNHPYGSYRMTDGSDAMLSVARMRYREKMANGDLVIENQDAIRLRCPDRSYDRLIATHVLEHIVRPVDALREWDRVVRTGGLISLVLPCDPGLLWRFGRHFGPRRNASRHGLPYDYVQAAEHVNSIFNLVVFIRHHFDHVAELWYPTRIAAPDINLFYICHITT